MLIGAWASIHMIRIIMLSCNQPTKENDFANQHSSIQARRTRQNYNCEGFAQHAFNEKQYVIGLCDWLDPMINVNFWSRALFQNLFAAIPVQGA